MEVLSNVQAFIKERNKIMCLLPVETLPRRTLAVVLVPNDAFALSVDTNLEVHHLTEFLSTDETGHAELLKMCLASSQLNSGFFF